MSTAVIDAPATSRTMHAPFVVERAEATADDGLTLEGYAAVFNSPTRISDQDGEYTEVIAPGSFRRTAQGRVALMFEHGRHPLIGPMPIGAIQELREDDRGLWVRARLFDNWMVHPLRDAIRDGAIDGMSFRFDIEKQAWSGSGSQRVRTIREVKLYELGPVVFPAYSDTTLVLRSLNSFAVSHRADLDAWNSAVARDLARDEGEGETPATEGETPEVTESPETDAPDEGDGGDTGETPGTSEEPADSPGTSDEPATTDGTEAKSLDVPTSWAARKAFARRIEASYFGVGKVA